MKKLKILTVNKPENDYLPDYSCIEPLSNGEYVYQVLVTDSTSFIIEAILKPGFYKEAYIDNYQKIPIRIILSAKNRIDLREKCLKIMAGFPADRFAHGYP